MNLSRCEQGHFFDKEKNAVCPYCAQGAQQDDSLTTLYTEDMDSTVPVTEQLDMGANQPNMVFPGNQNFGMPQNNGFDNGYMAQPMASQRPSVAPAPAPTVPPVQPQVMPEPFSNVDDDDDDHTIGIFDGMFGEPEPAAPAPVTSPVQAAPAPAQVASSQPALPPRSTSPCTGWLIALGGAHVGIDFRLKAGKNFIGRGNDMDVPLVGDKSISRNKHAIVVYEPKQHLYLIQPGESSELVYLNDSVVLSPMQLNAYDIITLGEVQLLFMPLCGEKFSWSDISKK